MIAHEFHLLFFNNLSLFIFLNIFILLFLHFYLRKLLIAGVFDPFYLVLIFGFSTNYAIIIGLFILNYISINLFITIFMYNIIFIFLFKKFSMIRYKKNSFLRIYIYSLEKIDGKFIFYTVVSLYMLVSSYILFKIGFGFFSSTNRFDNARGFGHFIRLLDLLQPFILSFTTLMLMNRKSLISKIIFVFFILIFVFYSAFINGAKISVIFSILTIVFTICLFYNPKKFRVNVFTIILLFFIGFVFATAALKMNLIMNNENIDKKSELINGIPIVLEKLILRIVANGNTSYLLLPNDIIEKIETDSVISRFLSSIIGISLSSKIMGYDTSSYSVGRQANLYYDPKVEIAGGPTSHLDLFAYVYFGPFFGCFFIIITAFTLGHIYSAIINYRKKNFLSIAFLSTLWVRSVIVIVEPTIGYAYIIDVFIFFTILYILVNLLMISKKVIYYE